MAEITGNVKDKRAGGVRDTWRSLPHRFIIGICRDLAIDSTKLSQEHGSDGVPQDDEIVGQDWQL